jgi:hypothetical protein
MDYCCAISGGEANAAAASRLRQNCFGFITSGALTPVNHRFDRLASLKVKQT